MRKLVAFAALALIGTCASAADNGIYLGAATSVDATLDGGQFLSNLDLKDHPYKLIIGVRPIDHFAIEGSYVDFGSATLPFLTPDAGVNAKTKIYDAFALGYLPLPVPFIDIYGKVGFAYWDTNVRLTTIAGPQPQVSDSGTDFAYGAGVQARFGSFAVRLEYERFEVSNTDRVDLTSLGVTWTFL
jgi:opacity protein-like surface antigen